VEDADLPMEPVAKVPGKSTTKNKK
jgi:hypothetical protein